MHSSGQLINKNNKWERKHPLVSFIHKHEAQCIIYIHTCIQVYGRCIHALECLISTFQDKNIWISVIDMLKKKDKLPAVAFTFSKKKIDENAQNLLSKDLTTASEKSEIHIFFHSAIKKLKPPDQKLPQVILIPSRWCFILIQSYLMFFLCEIPYGKSL